MTKFVEFKECKGHFDQDNNAIPYTRASVNLENIMCVKENSNKTAPNVTQITFQRLNEDGISNLWVIGSYDEIMQKIKSALGIQEKIEGATLIAQ